ncbi:hypothetical protein CQZ91_21590 [Bacillus cereus]|uniref:hypothetical protein n=1 Tax=Bacillus cereus TaxID=1396 RepID=UPI000CFC2A96|nr:hypothetical protein [Bacillus cereus]PRC96585.1 hypothetical protein CQZ92_21535 [Bacillus cereus]PRD02462.1 hypothetical protein CQZ91_21590 [Bacillus cereus]
MSNYKEKLKEEIETFLVSIDPKNKQVKSIQKDCPHCLEEDAYKKYPEYDYGYCTNCSREDGFEHYTRVKESRTKEYNGIVTKLQEVLKTV